MEGAFYLWGLMNLKSFSSSEAGLWKSAFGLSRAGNFTDEALGRQTGTNILRLNAPFDELAGDLGMSAEAMQNRWREARKFSAARKNGFALFV